LDAKVTPWTGALIDHGPQASKIVAPVNAVRSPSWKGPTHFKERFTGDWLRGISLLQKGPASFMKGKEVWAIDWTLLKHTNLVPSLEAGSRSEDIKDSPFNCDFFFIGVYYELQVSFSKETQINRYLRIRNCLLQGPVFGRPQSWFSHPQRTQESSWNTHCIIFMDICFLFHLASAALCFWFVDSLLELIAD
jgi:hypothetical protein